MRWTAPLRSSLNLWPPGTSPHPICSATCGAPWLCWQQPWAAWDTLGRPARFALLQGFVAVMYAGALWRAAARVPLGILALLGTGALFAYFGQTYQTGADPWQLFAWWAVLTLPLAVAARSDALWAPWVLVATTGIALWAQAHTGHRWRVLPQDLGVHLLALSAALGITAAMLPAWQRLTGAGLWSLRIAGTLAITLVTTSALPALFHSPVAPHYALGLLLLAGTVVVAGQRRFFDLFLLSAATLGLNVLLVAGLARLLLEGSRGDLIGGLLMVGLMAAGLLAGSVQLVMRMARKAQINDPLHAEPSAPPAPTSAGTTKDHP
jgi:uncharacterized membrane protein